MTGPFPVLSLAIGWTLLILGAWAIARQRRLLAPIAVAMAAAGGISWWILATPMPQREMTYGDGIVMVSAVPVTLFGFAVCGLMAWPALRTWAPTPGKSAPPGVAVTLLVVGLATLLCGWCGAAYMDQSLKSQDARIVSAFALALVILILATLLWKRIQPQWNPSVVILRSLIAYDLLGLLSLWIER